MLLAGSIDGCGVRRILALTTDEVCYENSNEHTRQRALCYLLISNVEIVLSPPKLLLRQLSEAGVQLT